MLEESHHIIFQSWVISKIPVNSKIKRIKRKLKLKNLIESLTLVDKKHLKTFKFKSLPLTWLMKMIHPTLTHLS